MHLRLCLCYICGVAGIFQDGTLQFEPGAFTVQSVDFFDCTGPAFSREWDEFHSLVVEWERHISYFERPGVTSLTVEGNVVGNRVAEMSHELLSRWWPRISSEHHLGLDEVVRGDREVETLGGVCYYGLVQALWIRAQMIMLQQGYTEFTLYEAILELESAKQVLGTDFRLDYVDSTRWPVRSLDIHMTIQKKSHTKVPQFKHLSNFPKIEDTTATVPTIDFFSDRRPDARDPLESRELRVAAWGSHAALLSEPVTMVRGALPEWQVLVVWYVSQCRFQDPVHHYHCRLNCELFGECAFYQDSHNLARTLLRLVDYAAEGVGEAADVHQESTIGKLLDITSNLWDTDGSLRAAQLIICTIPMICSLLRAVTPVPVLGYFSMLHYQDTQHEGLTEWGLMHLAEMGRNAQRNALAFQCKYLADVAGFQLGVQLPVVRPFGLYVYGQHAASLFPQPFKELPPHAGNRAHTVIVPRSHFIMTGTFLHALRAFIDNMEPAFPLNFTVIRSAKQPTDENVNMAHAPPSERLSDMLAGDRNVFVESKKMLQYRAALFLPQSPNMMTLYELHSMYVPTFIPSRDWMYRLYHQRNWMTFNVHMPHLSARNFSAGGRPRRMRSPLPDPEVFGWHDPYVLWMYLFEGRFETNFPGVLQFESFPQLIEGLLYRDLPQVREKMRQHNAEAFGPVLNWYRAAVLNLIL
eukprot:TRINITY_DN101916_c0_g1_i1.p1 TRINITY_DN101916_c0_g1~~TRINITY_DN101916_c0_g1_i1.p1  ORF type:complete len:694 (-),score=105.34 TRINITY_DN101916_c0_g1_i1:4-2085(-)